MSAAHGPDAGDADLAAAPGEAGRPGHAFCPGQRHDS